jgi:RNA polymerase sigma-70 factor (ECF subfamily)
MCDPVWLRHTTIEASRKRHFLVAYRPGLAPPEAAPAPKYSIEMGAETVLFSTAILSPVTQRHIVHAWLRDSLLAEMPSPSFAITASESPMSVHAEFPKPGEEVMAHRSVALDNESTVFDSKLVETIISGDQAAFAMLMRRFSGLLYRTVRAIVKDESDAEDVVQNAFILAYRKLHTFRGASKLSTWLVRIAVNEALTCLRKRARLDRIVTPATGAPDAFDDVTTTAACNDEYLPEHMAIRSELLQLICDRVEALPSAYRNVFVLRAVDGLSVVETARDLGIPRATVRTRYFRARTRLCQALSSLCAIDERFARPTSKCHLSAQNWI